MSIPTLAVLGAGRQGEAVAHDFAVHASAERILLADRDLAVAEAAARHVDTLAGRAVAEPRQLDATDPDSLRKLLADADGVLSALPYFLNPTAAAAAIEAKTHFADLGGNAAISRQILDMDDAARAAGVTLVPDCGLVPGLSATMTAALMERFEEPTGIKLRCGGLPQHPTGILNYQLVFSIAGLTNEYLGHADVIRDGELMSVPTLEELESLDFPRPVGPCEAFTTSGGTSTLPQTFGDRLLNLDYKTVRYPGHCEKIRVLLELGLLSDDKVTVEGGTVRPRDVFHAVAAPRLEGDGHDLIVIRAEVCGRHEGTEQTWRLDILDLHDEVTGFSAMQRMTGYPAAMVVAALTRGEAQPGATPLETVLPAQPLLKGLARRGIRMTESRHSS